MQCQNCKKENRSKSKFCRFCGAKLSPLSNNNENSATDLLVVKLRTFKDYLLKSNKIVVFITIFLLFLFVASALAGPKVNDLYKVSQAISDAQKLEASNNYNAALVALASASDRWSFDSQKNKIVHLKDRQMRFIKDKENFDIALEKEKNRKFSDAAALLQAIDSDFPEYNSVRDKLMLILKEQADDSVLQAKKAAAAQAEANRQAEEATAAAARAQADKMMAEAQAAAAAEARARAEAQAAAQAQAAREAQAKADALRSTQTNAYWDKWRRAQTYIMSGHSNISTALSYLSASSFTSTLNYLTYALSDYTSAKNILGNDYITENRGAHIYLQLALDNFIEEEKAYFNAVYYLNSSYITQAEYYLNEGNRYIRSSNDSLGKY